MRDATISIEVAEHLVTELVEIFGLDSAKEAVEHALGRLANILEIEALNRENQDSYWPGFEPGEYFFTGDSPMEDDEPGA